MQNFTLKCYPMDLKLNSTLFFTLIGDLGLLEANIIPKLRTPGNYCHGCDFCGGGGGLVVGGGA